MKIRTKPLYLLLLFVLFNACKQTEKKEVENESHEQLNTDTTKTSTIQVGKGPDAMFLTPDQKKIYIANVEDTTISVLNTQTDLVERTISGIRNPWGFSRLGNTNEVAVSAYDKQIVVIDFTTDKIVRQQEFDSPLGGVVTSKDGKFIFVIAIEAKKVWKLNAQTFKIMDTYDTGNAPDGIGISASENNIYVTNTEDGTISIINVKTKTSRLLNTGGKPELVHSNHDRSMLFISNFKENKIHIINSDKGEFIQEISDLDGPEEAVPNAAEDTLYVVNFNNSKIVAYKMEGFEKLEKEYIAGKQPIGIVSLENKLYVTNYGDNSVSVINLK